MSESAKAVFLSYASQDAEAARRIAEALRVSGVEVWFDAEGGLETGDEWDAKIRRQIKECVLFLPIISANTQAREEGYFRIEWDLAAERARGIASGVAFILPIVIDDTREPDALVPDRFRSVQWTRLPGGEVTPEVKARFLKLWSHRAGMAKQQQQSAAPASVSPPASAKPRGINKVALGLVAVAAVAAIFLLVRPRPTEPSTTSGTPAAAHPATAADYPRDPELRRARALLYSMDAIPEDFVLAEDIVKPLVAQRPNDPEVATVAAEISLEFLVRGFDLTASRRSQIQRQAERAAQLAPDNSYALAALARFLLFIDAQHSRAEDLIRRSIALRPNEARFHRTLYEILSRTKPSAEVDAYGERMAAQFPDDALVAYDIARRFKDANDLAQAEKWFDLCLGHEKPPSFAYIWKAWIEIWVHGNLPAAKQWLDRVPDRQRANSRVASARYLHAMLSGETDHALRALNETADDWLSDFDYTGPKALLVGNLQLQRGHSDVAKVVLESALAAVTAAADKTPTDLRLQRARMWVLISLGRMEEARAIQRVLLQSTRRPYQLTLRSIGWNNQLVSCLLLGMRDDATAQLREACTDPNSRLVIRNMFKLDPRLAPWREDLEITALLAEPVSAKPARAVSALVLQGREMLEKYTVDDTQRETLALAEELAKRALQADVTDADAWSLSAQIASSYITTARDRSPARFAEVTAAAEKAMQLAPDSDEALLARAIAYRRRAATRGEAERILRELVQRHPDDRRMLRALGNTLRTRGANEEALGFFRQSAALPGGDARAELFCAEVLQGLGRHEEAAAAAERSFAVQPTGSVRLFKVNLARLRGDLALARAELAKMPPAVLLDDRGAAVAANVWLWSREPEKVIAALEVIPGDDLYNAFFYGPKSLMLGFAHEMAGRKEVAKVQWRIASRNLDERAKADPMMMVDPLYLGTKMFLDFLIDDPDKREGARQMLRVYMQMGVVVDMDPAWDPAKLFTLLGRQDVMIDLAEIILQSGEMPQLREQLRTDKRYDPLRGNPRFEALLAEPKK